LAACPDQVVRVAVSGTDLGTNWANVFHVFLSYAATPTQENLDDWLAAFAAAYELQFLPEFYGNVTVVEAKATLFVSPGVVMASEYTLGDTGTSGNSPVPDASGAKVLSWQSSAYWRGGKPRTYLPGLSIPDIQSGTVNQLHSTYIPDLAAKGVAFLVAVNALAFGEISGGQLGFVSFTSGGVTRTPPIFVGITGCVVHPRIGTQRRRLGKWLV
jgi:hypothetical protein